MHEPAIEVSGVWKSFSRGERHGSLRELLPALAARFVSRERRPPLADDRFWAVEDVSFKVQRGEALGIIGPNGSGKSTLLKLLTRILRPSRGTVLTRGRVGALIEVGAAFHPDLTGRENAFLQGAIYGMSATEIARRLDSIVEFAGVGDFLDTPIKRYSSGMQARLGFSVAAHLEPDVLLIDEVLAVGDASFQERCISRMKAFKNAGTAIVFVSHNLKAVSELCDRTLYLRRSIQAEGATEEVIASYLSWVRGHASSTADDGISIRSGGLFDENGEAPTVTPSGAALSLDVEYRAARGFSRDLTFTFDVYRSTDSFRVYTGAFRGADLGLRQFRPDEIVSLRFRFQTHLVGGQYHVALHVNDVETTRQVAGLSPAAVFRVQGTRSIGGIADLGVRGEIIRVSKTP